jgi:Fe-S-cluster containining protein
VVDEFHDPVDRPRLDLARHGLTDLARKSVYTLKSAELDRLLAAFAADNIAPVIRGLLFSRSNIDRLLALSDCRRCGQCCLPNPVTPLYPGAMVYDKELKLIAARSRYTHKQLTKRAPMNKDPNLPARRFLPFPCMFYRKGKCEVYELRPLACRVYPLTDVPGGGGVSINVRCDYGKEIYKGVITRQRPRGQM